MASSEKHSSKNRLLAALPPNEYRRLLPKLETVSLSLKQRIYESLRTIDYVHFPLNGIISIVAFMNDGTGIEVATVGNEGMVGLPVFLGADKTPLVAFQQMPGESMRMDPKSSARRSNGMALLLPFSISIPRLLWCRSRKETLVIVRIRLRSGAPVGS
jgi:hypothetical protein